MTLRAALTLLCVLLVGACSANADGVPTSTSYVINFTISDSTGIFSIGPGHFSFDSGDQKNTTISMPMLPDFSVPAMLDIGPSCTGPTDQCASPVSSEGGTTVNFMQTSQGDDSLHLDQNGLVSGLNVDSTVPLPLLAPTVDFCSNTVEISCGQPDATLQLNLDGSWTVDIGTTDGSGMYIVSPVPEPSTLGFLAGAAVLGIAARRRRVCR